MGKAYIDGTYKTGLTPFALDLLGELVYLELPQVGENLKLMIQLVLLKL